MFCARGVVEVAELRSLSTASRSTTRLGRPARVELSSTAGGFKRSRQRRAAGHTTRARVDGFARVKKPFGICSGRLLHRSYLRGHKAKGSAVVAAASKAAARRVCASGGIGGGFTITLAIPPPAEVEKSCVGYPADQAKAWPAKTRSRPGQNPAKAEPRRFI